MAKSTHNREILHHSKVAYDGGGYAALGVLESQVSESLCVARKWHIGCAAQPARGRRKATLCTAFCRLCSFTIHLAEPVISIFLYTLVSHLPLILHAFLHLAAPSN